MSTVELSSTAWPAAQLAEAVDTVIIAHQGRHGSNGSTVSRPPNASSPPTDETALTQWIDGTASRHGWEAEATHASFAELEALLQHAAPAIIRLPPTPSVQNLPNATDAEFLLLTGSNGRSVTLIQPNRKSTRIALTAVRDALSRDLTQPHTAALNRILERGAIAEERQTRVRHSLLAEMVGTTPITGCWQLRMSPGIALSEQTRRLGTRRYGGLLGGIMVMQLLLTILAWWMIGQSALTGHFEWGWLWGWALMLLSTIPLQLAMNSVQSNLVLGLSSHFKERLLFGALRLRPEATRLEGVGHFLGRVFSADALEQLSLAGGFVALLSLLQLCFAAVVLALGAGGWPHVLLLALWGGLMLILGWRTYIHERRIHATRRGLTTDLVERMVGHRTRLAQESRARWHATEDQDLAHYQQQLQQSDRASSRFKALIPRGWMMVGLAWFFAALLMEEHSVAEVAISLGGILFARQAFSSIVLGTQSIVGAALAWADVKPLFAAATLREECSGEMDRHQTGKLPLDAPVPLRQGLDGGRQPILTLRNVGFRYPNRDRAILNECNLQVHAGDRLLLQGPSGGGKSTLVNLMAGLQKTDRGTLLLHGVDRPRIEEEHWRQRIVAVPQFHENHILTGTLAFNLLLGRSWPASSQDLERAASVCRALGLGPLLDRMPAGLQQIVGESGWQLSHGERSRLYIARAILQDADLVILDESFGALDPESLAEALQTVLDHVPTLLVVAHP